MRALALVDGRPRLVDRPTETKPGEASVRVRVAGICATDLELAKGYLGFQGTLGHEFVGEVLSAPEAALVGRRVVGEINCPCGRCPTCRAERPTHCPQRTVLGIAGRDGAFAETLSLPVANLHPVPDDVPDEAAVFIEPLAAACELLEQIHLRPTDRVVILGAGRLGQLCARVVALTGAELAVVAGSPEKRARLPRGVTAVDRADAAAVAALAMADVAVDCTGSPEGLAQAATLTRPRGTIVLKTTVHLPGRPDTNRWVIDEQTIVGSRCGPFAPALRLLARGAVRLDDLVTARYPLERGLEALEAAARPEALKVLLTPPST